MISRTSTPASAGPLQAAEAGAAPARSAAGAAVVTSISSPVRSTKTSSRLAGRRSPSGACAVAAVGDSTAIEVPVRRVRRPARGAWRPRPRASAGGGAVDLHRLAAGVACDELGRAARRRRRGRADMIVTRVGQALGLLDVVRRHQDRHALGAQAVDQRPQLLAHLGVEPDGRLVQQHQPRPVHQRAGDQQAPPHAARELVDLRVARGRRGWRCSSARSIAACRSPRGRGRGG